MKKITAIILAVLMLTSLTVFAVSADEPNNTTGIEGEINYAFKAPYTAQKNGTDIDETTMANSCLAGKEDKVVNDDDTTDYLVLLTDGVSGYEELGGVSVVYTGTGASITVIVDLGAIKSDITKIRFKNVRISAQRYKEGEVDANGNPVPLGNRNMEYEKTFVWTSYDGEEYSRIKYDKETAIELTPSSANPDLTVEAAEFVDITYTFDAAVAGRYVKMSFNSNTYCLSVDEIQIIGAGAEDIDPDTVLTSKEEDAEPSEDASVDDSEEASAEDASADASADESKADESKADESKADESKADTSKADEKDGGSKTGLIIGIVAAVVVIAVVVVVVLKKKK